MESHPYKQAQNKEPPLSSREWLLFRLSVRLGVKLQAVPVPPAHSLHER